MPITRAAQSRLAEERRNGAAAENPPNSLRDSSTTPSAGSSFFSLWGNSWIDLTPIRRLLYQLIENVTVLQNQQNTHECTTASQYSALMARLDNLRASICHLSAEREALRTENARIVDDYNRLLQTYNGTVSENQYLKNQLEVSRANEARTRAKLDELVVPFTEATNKLNEMVLNSAQRQWLKGACRCLSHWSRARAAPIRSRTAPKGGNPFMGRKLPNTSLYGQGVSRSNLKIDQCAGACVTTDRATI